MAVDRGNELALLEPVVEIGGQRETGVDAATLQHLGQDWPHGRSAGAETDDLDLDVLTGRIGPEPGSVFLVTLCRQQGIALLRVYFQRIMLGQQVFHRVEIWL